MLLLYMPFPTRKACTLSTQSSAKNTWASHVLLAVLACAWLWLAEYVVTVPFIVTVGGVALIVLVGGIVSSTQARQLVRRHRSEVQRLTQGAERKVAELEQLVKMLPVLRSIFTALHPKQAHCPSAGYYFAEWLAWALREPGANVMEWMMIYRRAGSRGLPALKGLFGHLDPGAVKALQQDVAMNVQGAIADIVLRSKRVPEATQPADSSDASVTDIGVKKRKQPQAQRPNKAAA
jgi:hypothetical protein